MDSVKVHNERQFEASKKRGQEVIKNYELWLQENVFRKQEQKCNSTSDKR